MLITIEDDNGVEVSMTLPSKKEVCPECEGTGFVLCEGMRGHAYSVEEFYESFDDEDREAYFTRGGKYDVQCHVCHRNNVIDVVDEERLSETQKKFYQEWCNIQARIARDRADDARTRRMESGCWD